MNVCGLDIHKSRVWVHIKDVKGNDIFENVIIRNPDGLENLRQMCQKHQVSKAIMESTSTYWVPVYQALHKIGIQSSVVNAYQLRVLGRHKTDEKDAKLLATWGLLNVLSASYIPSLEIHQLRQLVRARINILKHRTGAIAQLKSLLEGECPGLTPALGKLAGKYAQFFLQDWGASSLNYEDWIQSIPHAGTRKALLRRKSVLGYWWHIPLHNTTHHLMQYHIRQYQFYTDELVKIEGQIGLKLPETGLSKAVNNIRTIPGFGFLTAVTVACELGSAERFKNKREAAASCGLTPKLKGSAGFTVAGKITKHGPKSVRRAVHVVCKGVIHRSPKHREFFERVKARRGGAKAMVALCRKLVELSWVLWSQDSHYVAA